MSDFVKPEPKNDSPLCAETAYLNLRSSGHGSQALERPEPLAKARSAYQDFFPLWRDADEGIPAVGTEPMLASPLTLVFIPTVPARCRSDAAMLIEYGSNPFARSR